MGFKLGIAIQELLISCENIRVLDGLGSRDCDEYRSFKEILFEYFAKIIESKEV